MAVSIEDILLARSMQDQQEGPDLGTSALIGAGLAGTAGIAIGDLAQRVRPMTQQRAMPSGPMSRLKPGHRMAGGLVGAILGGTLGAGARQMMIQDSPAANMLAKMQAQGTLNPMDRSQLQSVLRDIYNNPGM